MPIRNLYVYIIHSKKLTERRKVIDTFRKDIGKFSFSSLKISNIDIIETNEPEEITSNEIQRLINYNPITTDDENLKIYNQLIRILHINNISNAMKHFDAIKKISECEDANGVHLVLEDDIMYENRMCLLLDKLVSKLSDNDEIVFLGMPNNEEVKNSNVIIKESKDIFKVLPYNDSYILNKDTAKKLIDTFIPLKYYTNIHMSYLCTLLNITIKQSVPNIFVDGSKYGSYISSQISNNELVFNKEYMYIKSLLVKPEITKEDLANVEKIRTSSSISANPDLMFIIGKFMHDKLKDYKSAKDIYQNAFDIYKRNNSILNNESIFIREFINIHKHHQNDI